MVFNMNMVTEEKIIENYERFMSLINEDTRAEQLTQMYTHLEDELTTAPASGKVHFHNAFPGGYLDHVLRVTDMALRVSVLYKENGGHIDFSKQELIFAALHHDLGKLGTEDGPYYVTQESDWKRKHGELYHQNQDIQYFKAPERGLMMLQKHGIAITEKEWLGIKLSDGMYDEGNKSYLVNYAVYPMKTNIHKIIHWADHMACSIEQDSARW